MKKITSIVIITLFLGLSFIPNISAENTGDTPSEAGTTPYKALVAQGYEIDSGWNYFTGNAQEWFKNWCYEVQSGVFNNNSISYRIRNYNVSFFYIIAHSHGESTHFLTQEGEYYTAQMLKEDMKDRSPMTFALICCCEGMSYTGPGSISYEFRKGQLNNTVTIGYSNFSRYKENGGTMWRALDWQDFLLYLINKGHIVKKAFDLSCFHFPDLAPYVKFVGDENLRIKEPKKDSSENNIAKSYIPQIKIKKNIHEIINLILYRFPILEKILFKYSKI